MMQAVYYARFGGVERLNLGEIPSPRPGVGEVLIRITLAGVSRLDAEILAGDYRADLPHAFPIIPGFEAVGMVAALGEGVTSVRVGERLCVFARKSLVQWGCYAQYVTVPATECVRVPDGVDDAQAATLPLAGLTAWQGLHSGKSSGGRPSPTVGLLAEPLAVALGLAVDAGDWTGNETGLRTRFDGVALSRLLALLAQGALPRLPVQILPLAQAGLAMMQVQQNQMSRLALDVA